MAAAVAVAVAEEDAATSCHRLHRRRRPLQRGLGQLAGMGMGGVPLDQGPGDPRRAAARLPVQPGEPFRHRRLHRRVMGKRLEVIRLPRQSARLGGVEEDQQAHPRLSLAADHRIGGHPAHGRPGGQPQGPRR